MFKSKSLIFSGLSTTVVGFGFIPTIVACAAPAQTNATGVNNDTKAIQDFIQNQNLTDNIFVAKKDQLKGNFFIKQVDGKFDEFKTEIEKYVSLNPVFNDFLTKDNNRYFKTIKQINFVPVVNATDLNVSLQIGSVTNDLNVITTKVNGYFSNSFTYSNPISATKKPQPTTPLNKADFEKQAEALKNGDLTLAKTAFQLTDPDWEKIKNMVEFKTGPGFVVLMEFKPEFLKQGYIFQTGTTSAEQYISRLLSEILAINA